MLLLWSVSRVAGPIFDNTSTMTPDVAIDCVEHERVLGLVASEYRKTAIFYCVQKKKENMKAKKRFVRW